MIRILYRLNVFLVHINNIGGYMHNTNGSVKIPHFEVACWWNDEWLPKHAISNDTKSFIERHCPLKFEEDYDTSHTVIKLPVWLKNTQDHTSIVVAHDTSTYEGVIQIGWVTASRNDLLDFLDMQRLSKKSIETVTHMILKHLKFLYYEQKNLERVTHLL